MSISPVEVALRARLVAVPAVVDKVGGAAAPRIYPLIRPQGSLLPALTYQRIAESRTDPLTLPPDPPYPGRLLTLARFQYDAWAGKYPDVTALALEVQRAFRYFTDAPAIGAVAFQSQEQLYESDTQTWRVRMDFDVLTEE
jgi:hypothetical protein